MEKKSAVIILRVNPDLKARIRDVAAREARSLGGQVRLVLEKAFGHDSQKD